VNAAHFIRPLRNPAEGRRGRQARNQAVMNAMNICLLILCVGIAALIYWGGFAEERRANRKVD
jgi:hypothetical protein